MNYRHAFHAGNFADVFKHVLMTRILLYLMRKDTPVFFLDTHAGCGAYDLAGADAARTGEWLHGLGRLQSAAAPPDVTALLQPYLQLATDAGPQSYPGSPLIAQRLLRAQDRLRLNELHPEDAEALERAVWRDGRAKVSRTDGYAALEAAVPPRERRGLVLVDPSFEVPGEWARMESALRAAHRKWATGIFALWYPIKDRDSVEATVSRFRNAALGKVTRFELLVEATPRRGRHDALALIGCGLLVVNPPYLLEDEAGILLPFLAQTFALGDAGTWQIERLAGEPGTLNQAPFRRPA